MTTDREFHEITALYLRLELPFTVGGCKESLNVSVHV